MIHFREEDEMSGAGLNNAFQKSDRGNVGSACSARVIRSALLPHHQLELFASVLDERVNGDPQMSLHGTFRLRPHACVKHWERLARLDYYYPKSLT